MDKVTLVDSRSIARTRDYSSVVVYNMINFRLGDDAAVVAAFLLADLSAFSYLWAECLGILGPSPKILDRYAGHQEHHE